MFKNVTWLAILGVAFGPATMAPAYGQSPTTETIAETDTQATPAMWLVRDDDSEFYLLGTFHILPPALEWKTPSLNAAFDAAQTVYFEVDASGPETQSKTVSVMMVDGFLPTGETLTSVLDPEDAESLKTITQGLGLPLASVDVMRPWQAFLTLSVQFIISQGFDPSSGVDSVLTQDAKADGKELQFFETIEQQLGFFTGLSSKTETDLLAITLRDWDQQIESFDDLFNAWIRGDGDYIDQQMNAALRDEAPNVFDVLLTQRNIAWADRIAADMENGEGVALVAVGAAHLVGDQSVQKLLEEKGFEVSPYGEASSQSSEDISPPGDTVSEIADDIEADEIDVEDVTEQIDDLAISEDELANAIEPANDNDLASDVLTDTEEDNAKNSDDAEETAILDGDPIGDLLEAADIQ